MEHHFDSEAANQYGIEIAVILHFFLQYYHFSAHIENQDAHYPSMTYCCTYFYYWDEEKIRELIVKLYTLKLI